MGIVKREGVNMKKVYPIILAETKDKEIPFLVYSPDFDAMTQGKSLNNALELADDLICGAAFDMEKRGEKIPVPSKIGKIDINTSPWAKESSGDIIEETKTLVSVDFDLYKQKMSQASVRRNVSLPAWLDAEATKARLNVSAVLQEALKERLSL